MSGQVLLLTGFKPSIVICMISLIIIILLSCSRSMVVICFMKLVSDGVSQNVIGRLARL